MGTRFVLVSLAPLIIRLLYLQNFFLISCLCMQRVGNNKIFLSSHDVEKTFVTSAKAKGSMVRTKRTLTTEHLA